MKNMRRGAKRSRKFVVKRNRKAAPDEILHHSVYVILLDPSVLQHPSILRLNPNREPGETMRLRRHDRIGGPGAFPEPQKRI